VSETEEPRLRITREDRRLVLRGDFDLAGEEPFGAALEPLLAEEGDVRLDLSAVTFIDSTGLRALLDAKERLGNAGSLILQRPSQAVRHLFEVSGVIGWLTIEEEPEGESPG
jgi:anti-sigma B factor antagonist